MSRFLLIPFLSFCLLLGAGASAAEEKTPTPEETMEQLDKVMGKQTVMTDQDWEAHWARKKVGELSPTGQLTLQVANDPKLKRSLLNDVARNPSVSKANVDGVKFSDTMKTLDAGRHEIIKEAIGDAIRETNRQILADTQGKPAKLDLLRSLLSINSGSTGKFDRDQDITLHFPSPEHEKRFFEAFAKVLKSDKYKLDVDPMGGMGLTIGRLEVTFHKGSNSLPDARFSTDIKQFSFDYRRVVENQLRNPEAYIGFGYEMEVAGRVDQTYKPGTTRVQEFVFKRTDAGPNGDPTRHFDLDKMSTECQAHVFNSTETVRRFVKSAFTQPWRHSQHAMHIASHTMQAFRHDRGNHEGTPDPTKGSLKYAGRVVEDLMMMKGYNTDPRKGPVVKWSDLTNEQKTEVIKQGNPAYGGGEDIRNMLDTAAFVFGEKKLPDHLKKDPAKVADLTELALSFNRRATITTVKSIAKEMLEPPDFDNNWLLHSDEPAAALLRKNMTPAQLNALNGPTTEAHRALYKQTITQAATENLLADMYLLHLMDSPEFNQHGSSPGQAAVDEILGHLRSTGGDPLKPGGPDNEKLAALFKLASQHAGLAVRHNNKNSTEADRQRARVEMDTLRNEIGKLVGAPAAGADIARNNRNPKPGTEPAPPSALREWGKHLTLLIALEVSEGCDRVRKQITVKNAKNYLYNRAAEEVFDPGNIVDVLDLARMYQDDATAEEYMQYLGMNAIGRFHWSVGLLIQAGNVQTEEDFVNLEKMTLFTVLAKLIPPAGMAKLYFDINKGIVDVTVGYFVRRKYSQFIDIYYFGKHAPPPEGSAFTSSAAKLYELFNDSGVGAPTAIVPDSCVNPNPPPACEPDTSNRFTERTYRGTRSIQTTTRTYGRGCLSVPALYRHYWAQWSSSKTKGIQAAHDKVIDALEDIATAAEERKDEATVNYCNRRLAEALTEFRQYLQSPVQRRVAEVLEAGMAIKGNVDSDIRPGLEERLMADFISGMRAHWDLTRMERNAARSRATQVAALADMKQLCDALVTEHLKPKKLPPIQLDIRPIIAANEHNGDIPLGYDITLVSKQPIPDGAPDVIITNETTMVLADGGNRAFKAGDRVKQTIQFKAINKLTGEILDTKAITQIVILPGREVSISGYKNPALGPLAKAGDCFIDSTVPFEVSLDNPPPLPWHFEYSEDGRSWSRSFSGETPVVKKDGSTTLRYRAVELGAKTIHAKACVDQNGVVIATGKLQFMVYQNPNSIVKPRPPVKPPALLDYEKAKMERDAARKQQPPPANIREIETRYQEAYRKYVDYIQNPPAPSKP